MSESDFLAALAEVGQRISDLRVEAENLAMPQAVVTSLLWLRDDMAGVLGDAAQAVANSKGG